MNDLLVAFGVLVVGYLIGSFPSGVLISRARGVDVRRFGSGKPGATNVLRTLGWRAAAPVFILDFLKGLLPVLLARYLIGTPIAEVAAGTGAIVGHNWPIFAGFNGGRGVATTFGAYIPASPLGAFIGVLTFILIVWRTRYVSLGSIVAPIVGVAALLIEAVAGRPVPGEFIVYGIGAATLLIVRHGDNISRLRKGTERKFGDRATA